MAGFGAMVGSRSRPVVTRSRNGRLKKWMAGLPARNAKVPSAVRSSFISFGMSEYSMIPHRPSISARMPTFSVAFSLNTTFDDTSEPVSTCRPRNAGSPTFTSGLST